MSTSTSTIKWLFSLTGAFFRNVPIATTIVVVMTLFSQLAMMMAFLMPLKVIMLLGSDGIPKFFPRALLEIDKNTLIISLVFLSITAYIASAIFKYISEKMTDRGVTKLLNQTQKIIIFENQDNIASNAYTKYTTALAGLTFFLITISALYTFYQHVAILITSFLLLVYIITYILYSSNAQVEQFIKNKPQAVAGALISNIGFLLIFLYIVIDFLYLTPPEFIIALATIIISRLMLVRLSFAIAYILSLSLEKDKINALFFHHHAFIPANIKQHKTAWELLSDDMLSQWVEPVLKEATNKQITLTDLIVQWKQTRLKNIVLLHIEAPSITQSFLIKIFEERASSQAQHESTLIVDNNALPCPPLLLATKIESYHCHIFDITGFEFLSAKESFKRNNETNAQLLRITPSEELTERYKRSKAFLWERLNTDMSDRLLLVASEQDKQVVQQFQNALPKITAILRKLPLSFVNYKQNHTALIQGSNDKMVSFHWPTWIIEPTGFGIESQTDEDIENNINNVIQVASKYRTDLKRFPIEAYELAGLLSEFEKYYRLQQYKDAINISQFILDKLDRLYQSQPTVEINETESSR